MDKYSGKIGIEQSSFLHTGNSVYPSDNFVWIQIYVTHDDMQEATSLIEKDLVLFFANNREKLIDKYGLFKMIIIRFFHTGEDGKITVFRSQRYVYDEHDQRWEWKF